MPRLKIKGINLRFATADDVDIPAYDNTKLVAANTCPTWGILRYQLHRVMSNVGRAMALEAGGACHELFAALRLYQLRFYDVNNERSKVYNKPEIAAQLFEFHGNRLYRDKWPYLLETLEGSEDNNTRMLNFCLCALELSGFYDDDRDKRRTMTNLEEACMAYIDRWNFSHPIWVRTSDDPTSDVGIEVPFDVVITYTLDDDTTRVYRFIGKMDGMREYSDGPRLEENKTGARLNDAWSDSFDMASQVTGYLIVASLLANTLLDKARIFGLAIPLPKSIDLEGVVRVDVKRETYQVQRWFEWFLHTVTSVYEEYNGDPINAPKYTHSCNRYFRPCSFLPFCTLDNGEMTACIDDMPIREWSPLKDEGANADE